jgi:hypothetical protein
MAEKSLEEEEIQSCGPRAIACQEVMNMNAGGGHCGWMRLPGRTWQLVCQGLSHDDVLADLLRHADTVAGVPKDLIVLEADQHPAGRLTKYARVEDGAIGFFDASAGECGAAEATSGRLRRRNASRAILCNL